MPSFAYKLQTCQVFRRALKLARAWPEIVMDTKTPLSQKTMKEVMYIRSEAMEMKKEENKKLSDEEVQDKLRDAMNRMDIAEHYKIPYPKAHHAATGSADARDIHSAYNVFAAHQGTAIYSPIPGAGDEWTS